MKFIERKNLGLEMICALALVQSALRLLLVAVILNGGFPETEMAVTLDGQAYIVLAFLALGLLGFVCTFALYRRSAVGYYGTMALSVVTIAFDAWAIYAVQITALLGIILPAVFIIYLLVRRKEFPAVVG
jgi:hypothetical protein